MFVALELPGEVRHSLMVWRTGVIGTVSGLRETSGESLHVTLSFLGSRPVAEVEAIARACEATDTQAAMALALGSAIWLPPRRPRVLAVTVEDPDDGLRALQAELSARLQAGGWYTPERRPFLPHVTVARVGRAAGRPARNARAVRDARAGRSARPRPPELDPPEARRFTGTVVTLFRSWLGPGGARYEALRTVALRG